MTDIRTDETYIARENGEKRVVTREELFRDTRYEDWVATASGQAGLERRTGGLFSSPVTYFWAAGILLPILVMWFFWKRARM